MVHSSQEMLFEIYEYVKPKPNMPLSGSYFGSWMVIAIHLCPSS